MAIVEDVVRTVLEVAVGRAQPPPAAIAFCGVLVCPGGLGVVRGDTDPVIARRATGAVASTVTLGSSCCGELVSTSVLQPAKGSRTMVIAARTRPATTNFLDFFTLESSCTNFISTQHTAGMSYEKPI